MLLFFYIFLIFSNENESSCNSRNDLLDKRKILHKKIKSLKQKFNENDQEFDETARQCKNKCYSSMLQLKLEKLAEESCELIDKITQCQKDLYFLSQRHPENSTDDCFD
ncbi:hypothetical protein M153_2810009060 [Pseudoloma neurophilia]|uniref:Uncharacterized protein n=1 Tax=Pseudoloma neurophilia TaxID=146866 RepID=A0A0R0M5I4_9MICR|nr:hypothetical protein M153_2810009060 [Pseudoloma neurophilia]